MNPETGPGPGFLARFRKDERGNTLMLMAAALIPLAGMIGSGLDMSRAYMAKAKLQTACDAAALATRRFMGGTTLTSAARAEGEKFFYFNFPRGTMGTGNVTLSINAAATDVSEVEVRASTTVPTEIMKIFGKKDIPIDTECNADQDYVNNDIMLVLDVTGSMYCNIGTAPGGSCPSSAGTNSRITKLRDAGVNLFKALEGATGVRTRYGFMPYSVTVNVGKTAGFNRSWMRDPARYWRWVQVCTRYRSDGTCRESQSQLQFTPVDHTNSWFNNTWGGCVEERSTIGQSDSNNNPRIASAVSEADIDTVSTTNDQLKWQPYDADADQAGSSGFCPRPAQKLTEYSSRSDFDTAFRSSLQTVGGNTYHDIGMTWGMRFLSTTGMFASENPDMWSVGGGPSTRVDKHIIFFTDGELQVSGSTYSAYGVDDRDDRMLGGGSQNSKHQAHFLAACQTAREMGMTVWVIALDVNALDKIRPCASGDDHFYVSDGTDLDEIFTLIGKGIGKLRITK